MAEVTEIAQKYLGNIYHNPDLANIIKTKSYLELTLEPEDSHKGRIHAHTDSGLTIGIIKNRDRLLHSGDLYQTDSGKFLLIQLQEEEFLVLDFSSVDNETSLAILVHLGHILGNSHYPIAIDRDRIWVQLVTNKSVIETLINNTNIAGLKISYQKKSLDNSIAFSRHSH